MTEEQTLPNSERPEQPPETDRGGHDTLTPTEETLQHFVELVRGAVKDEMRAVVREEMEHHAKDELEHHKKVEGTMEQVLRYVHRFSDRLGRVEQRVEDHEQRLIKLEHPGVNFDVENEGG